MYITSLVLGILSLLISWIPIIGFIISIISLIICIIAMAKKKSEGKGMAIAGIILSILAVVFSLIMTIMTVGTAYMLNENANEINEKAEEVLKSSDIANAKAALVTIFADVINVNGADNFTGHINEYTSKYTDKNSGIPADEYYEKKLKTKGYNYDVIVTNTGIPNIIE